MKSICRHKPSLSFRNGIYSTFLLLGVAFLSTSCDVSRQLILENKTPYEVKINLGFYNQSKFSDIDSLIILNNEIGNNRSLIYGFGGWTNWDVPNLRREVSELHIEDSLIILNNAEINEWIQVKRKFFQKLKVTIEQPNE